MNATNMKKETYITQLNTTHAHTQQKKMVFHLPALFTIIFRFCNQKVKDDLVQS